MNICLLASRSIISALRMPFYAVRKGRQVGIYGTWSECENQVKNYRGAQFRKFPTREEAQAFVNGGSTRAFPVNNAANNIRKRTRGQDEESASSECLDSSNDTKRQRTSDIKWTVVYTDGACVANGRRSARGGIGVFWGYGDARNVSEPLPDGRQTNNRAEILACARAIEQAQESGVQELEIRTDSNFTIDCITHFIYSWKRNGWKKGDGKPVLNMEELLILDSQKRKFEDGGGRILFTHVNGHAGVPGNEAADRLAVQGAAKRA